MLRRGIDCGALVDPWNILGYQGLFPIFPGRDDTVLVDIRDPRELSRDGKVPGAFHCPRGMLEFWIDPASPYFKPMFGQDKKYVFFCAGGLRSALAAQTALHMGLKPVAHVRGGFGAWKKAGGPVEAAEEKK